MKKVLETAKNILLGGIIFLAIGIIYVWVTADKCYYAVRKPRRRR